MSTPTGFCHPSADGILPSQRRLGWQRDSGLCNLIWISRCSLGVFELSNNTSPAPSFPFTTRKKQHDSYAPLWRPLPTEKGDDWRGPASLPRPTLCISHWSTPAKQTPVYLSVTLNELSFPGLRQRSFQNERGVHGQNKDDTIRRPWVASRSPRESKETF